MFNHVQPGDQAFDALQALQWTLASGRVNRKKKRWAGIPRQSLNLSEYVSMILMKHDETDEALMLDET
jgi:hypothetical protein